MKIKFNSETLLQLNIITELKTPVSGFLFGQRIGKYILITNILTVQLDKKITDLTYETAFNQAGLKIIGVFFCNKDIFLNDWFSEDIIIEIKGSQCQAFQMVFENLEKAKQLKKISDIPFPE
jgi:hypothetical protein